MPLLHDADLRILEVIQDAVLQPGLWRQVLELTAHRVGGIAGSMSIEDPVHQTGLSLARFGYDPWFTGSKARLADFASITAGFRTPFAAAGTDRP